MSEPQILELNRFSRAEKLFVFFSMLTGFFISFEYAATRPSSSSIFLATFSPDWIPWVWFASVPVNLLVVYLYNLFLPRLGPLKMIGSVAFLVSTIHLICGCVLSKMPEIIFLQFIWKDIYILLMFKQLWSMIHSTIKASRARYLYGAIFGMGTLGSVIGSLIPGFFAVDLGSEQLFFCTLPIYALLFLFYRGAFYRSSLVQANFSQSLTIDPSPKESLLLIRRSSFLTAALLVVILMQVSVGLMDYQFNVHLSNAFHDLDLRTQYVGRIVGITNICSGLLQLIGGFLIIRIFGLKGSHFLVPSILLGNALMCWAVPSFAMVSLSYVLIKSIDFSLFGVIREMLYIPMKLDEKFRAKAIIDVFAYRSSKALVAALVLSLQLIAAEQILPTISGIAIAVCTFWLGVVFFLLRRVVPA